eukprot:1186182-Prorocentrum_minimum.AAC.1
MVAHSCAGGTFFHFYILNRVPNLDITRAPACPQDYDVGTHGSRASVQPTPQRHTLVRTDGPTGIYTGHVRLMSNSPHLLVRRENLPALPASHCSAVRIYPPPLFACRTRKGGAELRHGEEVRHFPIRTESHYTRLTRTNPTTPPGLDSQRRRRS